MTHSDFQQKIQKSLDPTVYRQGMLSADPVYVDGEFSAILISHLYGELNSPDIQENQFPV